MKTVRLKNIYLTRSDTFIQSFRFTSNKEPINFSGASSIEVDIREGITRQT
ncbi:MAG: hypothetical protein ACOC2U_01110 [bacterium]